jgi:hypothetical protein
VTNTKTFERDTGRSGKGTEILDVGDHGIYTPIPKRYREIEQDPGMYREIGDGRFRADVKRFVSVPKRSER